MSYETAFSFIANELNNVPLCLARNSPLTVDHLDIISPNRLLLGRNNNRALTGYATVGKPSRLLQQLESVYKSWWGIWYHQKISDFIPKRKKWSKHEGEVKVGDIVVKVDGFHELEEVNFNKTNKRRVQ